MDETLEKLGETIAGALAGSIVGHWVANGELTVPGVVVRTFHASPLDRDSPSGFALAVRNGDSYKHFVESVALSG